MTKKETKKEQNLLKFSIISAIFFALLGFIWGFSINSKMLIFDGIYSFISVILSGISLYVSDLIKKDDDERFQFGRSQIEPIAIVFKSLAIFSICLYAFLSALVDIFNGGSETNIESAMLYSVIATIACLGSWFYISLKMKKIKNSNLLMVEKYQWLMDTLLSSAVLIGFFIAYCLEGTKYSNLVKYIDPFMVILVTSYFFKMPISTLKSSIKELLLMAPDPELEIQESLDIICEEKKSKYDFEDYVTRVAKTGRELSIEISFINTDKNFNLNLYKSDLIRDEVEKELNNKTELKLWLTISFLNSKRHS